MVYDGKMKMDDLGGDGYWVYHIIPNGEQL